MNQKNLNRFITLAIKLCLLSLWMMISTGCEENQPPPSATQPDDRSKTAAKAPNTQKKSERGTHNGRLLPIPDNNGYVEVRWATRQNRLYLYFLDQDYNALAGVSQPAMYLKTAQGPVPVPLNRYTMDAEREIYYMADLHQWTDYYPVGTIRFLVNDDPHHVAITQPEANTQSTSLNMEPAQDYDKSG